MGYEHLIGSLEQERKMLVSQEIKRRKTLLDKVRSSDSNSFENAYKEEKQKLENKQKLM